MKRYDIAVIGGGASGLAAAITAKRTAGNLTVAVIERLPKIGKKILATGNGRCNLSNTELSPDRYHGSCKKFLTQTGRFSVVEFFESLGVICDDDGSGRIYPHCRSAASVLDALRLESVRLGVEEICGFEVKNIELKKSSGMPLYTISSDSGIITARNVILAGGGMSQQVLGSNGSMFGICDRLGIEYMKPYPALVPLKTDNALVKPLKGQRAEANVKFHAGGKIVGSRRGEVQFTEGLVSGICVFDLSYLYEQNKIDPELLIDLLPDMEKNAVTELLKNVRSVRSEAPSEDYLSGIFTRPLGVYILKRALSELPGITGNINNDQLVRLTETIKGLPFPVTGTAGSDRSQVTGGGIAADELTDDLEVKKAPGIYACGELIDIFGDCGGYNLDFAFSSGAVAGKKAALITSV